MVSWKIYYSDGSTFDSTQGEPDEAPAFGALVIVQFYNDGRSKNLLTGGDYYVFLESGSWVGCDLTGLVDRLAHRLPFKGFLVGRWVDVDSYHAIVARADKEVNFPVLQEGAN